MLFAIYSDYGSLLHRLRTLLVENSDYFMPLLRNNNSAYCESVALLVARRTNNGKVVGSRPTKVVCITVLTGNRLG